jgi:cell division protein FtsZ
MSFDPENIMPPGARIKVIGIGGGGGNAVNTMIRSNIEGVEFIAANTDVQALRFALAAKKIQIGKDLTKGLGAGADPDVGRDAALENRHEIQEMISGADMVFVTAGMGGGTGTGGAGVIAQIAREQGALTVGVVTKPFNFEGKRRRKHAEVGIAKLRESVDTLIIIPNQRLLQVATPDLTMIDAFKLADNVLVNAVRGISDIINVPGTVNVDFADVKTVMSCMGQALMGIGVASGAGRALAAATQAISSPLLEDVDIEGATGLLINITAGSNISLMEVNEACSVIQDAAHEDANIIFGAVIDESMGDAIRVTVIATGFPAEADEDDIIGAGAMGRMSQPSMRPNFGYRSSPPENFSRARPAQSPTLPSRRPPVVEKRIELEVRTPAQQPQIASIQSDFSRALGNSNGSATDDLTRLTLSGFDSEFAPPEPVFNSGAIPEPEPSIQLTNLTSPFAEPAPIVDHGLATCSRDEIGTPAFSPDFLRVPKEAVKARYIDSLMGAIAADAEESWAPNFEVTRAPIENFFGKGDQLDLGGDIDQTIDEALKIASQIEATRSEMDDDLDIPAFLRHGIRDIPIS